MASKDRISFGGNFTQKQIKTCEGRKKFNSALNTSYSTGSVQCMSRMEARYEELSDKKTRTTNDGGMKPHDNARKY